MLSYTKISKNLSQFLSLTSLTLDEFAKLLSFFTEVWETKMRYYTFDGKLRQRAYSEKSTSKLPLIGDKLFFILYYLKTNPLQVENPDLSGSLLRQILE